MPELPDVEGFRRLLQSHVVDEQITAVEVRDRGVLRDRSSDEFVQKLEGRRFGEPDRQGKWLLAPTDGPTLVFHFGMTGSLIWDGADGELQRFDRVSISVGNGRLIFRDQRKLRGLWLADDDDGLAKILGEQGPDALGLSGQRLTERLAGRNGALKSVLMDQRVLAGLGNMLSDEVLWRARIHPTRPFRDLQSRDGRTLVVACSGYSEPRCRSERSRDEPPGSVRNAHNRTRIVHVAGIGWRPAASVAVPPTGARPASRSPPEPPRGSGLGGDFFS